MSDHWVAVFDKSHSDKRFGRGLGEKEPEETEEEDEQEECETRFAARDGRGGAVASHSTHL